MGEIRFKFDYYKGTQALDYFAIQAGGRINKMKALKLIFFADRYHVRKYGRFVTNDNYVAMQHGPVPSTTKDIAEANDYLDETIKNYSQQFIEPVDNLVLKSKKNIDKSVLSDSDLEAFKFAWDTFGQYNQFELRDLTHLYPEWAKYKEALCSRSSIDIQLADFLKDPEAPVNKCYELDEEAKQARLANLTELSFIESLWGQDARCSP